ncbi:amidinotransferase [Actinomadura formosensis]|uniref:amidinotransferase n=1 Tax=Actinomadura formosensis TaxID=60706 RepID=UPI00082FD206|nr:amidinotransferase [Actinomadura formosensis]
MSTTGKSTTTVPPAERTGAVNSHTEWEALEEVVVGRMEGAVFPTWQSSMYPTVPESSWALFREKGGSPFPADLVAAAEEELDGFAAVLRDEGVTVVRPDPCDHSAPFSTPDWTSRGGLYSAMPRDCLTVIGDTIVEAPMSWRCRAHETAPFRSLIKSYFRGGARWLPAPHPQLTDELFQATDRQEGWSITDFEPVFDAADFMRFGEDIIVQRSHTTNDFGIDWLRRALGSDYRIHCLDVNDPHAMHIDATICPLAPGVLLVNPDRYRPSPLFRDWEIIEAPKPTLPEGWPMYLCSSWVSMNLLSLDERTVVVERQEEPLIEVLTQRGFRCVLVDFRHVYSFGGSFHCVTLDVRRRGDRRRYLN